MDVSPWPHSSYGDHPTKVKYRYSWITPIEFSPAGNHALYFGAQFLFRTTDDGNNWKIVSPDLTAKARILQTVIQQIMNRPLNVDTELFGVLPPPLFQKMLFGLEQTTA